MMQTALPTVNDLMNGTWSLIDPLYQELESHRLTVENVAEWLSNWSQLSRLVSQVGSQLYIRTTTNTADEEAEKRYHNYLETLDPQVQIANQRLTQNCSTAASNPPDSNYKCVICAPKPKYSVRRICRCSLRRKSSKRTTTRSAGHKRCNGTGRNSRYRD